MTADLAMPAIDELRHRRVNCGGRPMACPRHNVCVSQAVQLLHSPSPAYPLMPDWSENAVSDPSWLSSDDAFEAQWNTDADGVIGFLARRYDVQHDLAQRIAKRDAIAWTNSQNSAVLARNDSMRNKIKNRFIVMHKNKTALSDVVNRFGITKGNYYDVGCGGR